MEWWKLISLWEHIFIKKIHLLHRIEGIIWWDATGISLLRIVIDTIVYQSVLLRRLGQGPVGHQSLDKYADSSRQIMY